MKKLISRGSRFKIIPLEERILLDATAATAVLLAAVPPPSIPEASHTDAAPASNASDHAATATTDHAAVNTQNNASTPTNTTAHDSAVPITSFSPENSSSTTSSGTHVLIMPTNVEGYQALEKAAKSNVVVIEYNPDTTTLAELTAKINEQIHGKVDSIAFANKGQQDYFVISSDYAVSSETMHSSPELQHFWSQIGQMVKEGGQVAIFACDFAQNDVSLVHDIQGFVNSSNSQITVLASTDLTSNVDAGGNWFMEVGGVDAGMQYFNHDALADYHGHLLTFTVTTTSFTGNGSLSQALTNANNTAGLDTISFAISGTGTKTIGTDTNTLTITDSVNIDGTTQGVSSTPLIILKAHLTINASDVTIQSIDFNNNNSLTSPTILHNGGSNFNLVNDFFGTSASGLSLSNGYSSVEIHNVNGVHITGTNIFSGARGEALNIIDSSNVTVDGAIIGANLTLGTAIGNGSNGIILQNVNTATLNNLNVEGSTNTGVWVKNSTNVTLQNSHIGTNPAGTSNITYQNKLNGVVVENSTNSFIKTSTISNNLGSGIVVSNNSSGITIQGNHIGTNDDSTSARANSVDGITFNSASNNSVIGNTISGNTQNGISINSQSNFNTIQNNKIGVRDDGSSSRANGASGIVITASDNTSITGNTISKNTQKGIDLNSSNNTSITNNFIGVNSTGSATAGNGGVGINLQNVNGATISGNIISGNSGTGIRAQITTSVSNLNINNNNIGLDTTRTLDFGNNSRGIDLSNVSDSTISNNIISGNSGAGISLTNATNIYMSSLLVGVNGSANAAINNGAEGIKVDGGSTITITNSVVSGNSSEGIQIGNVSGLTISFSQIGSNSTVTTAIGNGSRGILLTNVNNASLDNLNIEASVKTGLYIENNSSQITLSNSHIGTNAAGTSASSFQNKESGVIVDNSFNLTLASSTISNNIGSGIIVQNGSTGITIQNDHIGTNDNSSSARPNTGSGILFDSATSCLVLNNTISGNAIMGVSITNNSDFITVQGNKIGVRDDGVSSRANLSHGISITDSDNATIVGNTISKNSDRGIDIVNANNTTITNNFIGVSSTGTATAANGGVGVNIDNVNGVSMSGNIISGNNGSGIRSLITSNLTNLDIHNNTIGSDITGTLDFGNNNIGIELYNVSNSTFSNNLISGNAAEGILLTNATNVNLLSNFIGVNTSTNAAINNGAEGIKIDGGDTITIFDGVISGNSLDGVLILNVSNLTISFSKIGSNSTDSTAVANGANGVELDNVVHATLDNVSIQGSKSTGLLIEGGSNDITVSHSHIGTNAAGTSSSSFQNKQGGIIIDNSFDVTIETSTISNNIGNGVTAIDSYNITIQNNHIGTNDSGSFTRPNTLDGVYFDDTTDSFILNNTISGNTENGIHLVNGSDNVLIQGNIIGLQDNGSSAKANDQSGVVVDGSDYVSIIDNTISENNNNGIDAVSVTNIIISDNLIGVSADGTIAAGNSNFGINLEDVDQVSISNNIISANGSAGIHTSTSTGVVTNMLITNNIIGSDVTGQLDYGNFRGLDLFNVMFLTVSGNLISGSNTDGVLITQAMNVNIINNKIGTNLSGTLAIKNVGDGIDIENTDTLLISGNVVSGNSLNGIYVGNSENIIINNNYVGTDATGITAIKNTLDGISLENVVTVSIHDNVVSGNGGDGIYLSNVTTLSFYNNLIGTNGQGDAIISNGSDGLEIDTGINIDILNNVFSGNHDNGVLLLDITNLNFSDNFVGTNGLGTADFGNGSVGLYLIGGSNLLITGNIFSGNVVVGVAIHDASHITFSNNLVGVDITGTTPIGNDGEGITFDDSSDITLTNNVISANGGEGLNFNDTTNVTISQNFIGTDVTGTLDLGNKGIAGLTINLSQNVMVDHNIILKNAQAGIKLGHDNDITITYNLISANGLEGIRVIGITNGTISHNFIGTDATGTLDFGNKGQGISDDNSINVLIDHNVISANVAAGIRLFHSSDITITNNMIGTDVLGRYALGNKESGIDVSGITNMVIQYNTISGNLINGIDMVEGTDDIASDNFTISFNKIGTDVTGSYAIPNIDGIHLTRVTHAFIFSNVISGNANDGFSSQQTDGIILSNNFIGLNAAGNGIIPNGDVGVRIRGSLNALIEFNVITGNLGTGVKCYEKSDNVIVINNYLGTNLYGDTTGNGGHGVEVDDTQNISITGNVIANNQNGVYVIKTSNSIIFSNQIFDNRSFGVAGVDATGTNVKDNSMAGNAFGISLFSTFHASLPIAPVITLSNTDLAGNTTISGIVIGTPGSIVTVDLYANSAHGPNGQILFFETPVIIGPNGQGQFTYQGFLPPAPFITATMTDASGNTSNFSIDVTVTNFRNAVNALNSLKTDSLMEQIVHTSHPVAIESVAITQGNNLASGLAAPQTAIFEPISQESNNNFGYNNAYSTLSIFDNHIENYSSHLSASKNVIIISTQTNNNEIKVEGDNIALPLAEFAKEEAFHENSQVIAAGITTTAILSQLSQLDAFDVSSSKSKNRNFTMISMLEDDE